MYTGVRMRGFQMSSIWLGILLLLMAMLMSEQAQALVCLQRGELPTAESTHAYEGELPLRYKDKERGSGLIWHIHMDIPVECAWSDEKGEELAAEQQSAQPLYVYLDPAWQDTALNAMDLDISVDHGRSIYPMGKHLHVLKSDQHMPSFSLMRICDHHDERGCRHWRNAPSQDYRTPVKVLLPIDLYLKHPLPQAAFSSRLLLQVGNNQQRPDVRTRLNVPVRLPGSEPSLPMLPRPDASGQKAFPIPLRKVLRHSISLLDGGS